MEEVFCEKKPLTESNDFLHSQELLLSRLTTESGDKIGDCTRVIRTFESQAEAIRFETIQGNYRGQKLEAARERILKLTDQISAQKDERAVLERTREGGVSELRRIKAEIVVVEQQIASRDFQKQIVSKAFAAERVTVTDADGNFQFEISSKINFVVVARASRKVIDKEEDYFWIVPLQRGQSTMLHNENLFHYP